MMAQAPFSVRAYGGVSRLLYPAAQALLARRRSRGKEDAVRLPERRGVAGLPRPEGILVWLHGASVGEVISLLPITEHLTSSGIAVLVTSGTVTSAEVAARRLPEGAIHQYLPLDLPAYVARFLDHWRPDIGIFAESELWPNLVHAAGKRGIHLLIVNGRMSERSYRRWRRLPGFIGAMLGRFELALAQTDGDAERLRALGAPRVQAIGNIKYDVAPPPADPDKLAILAEAVRGRPVLVAASTHPGEEALVAEAHAIASRETPGLLTLLIPRHPERGAEVAAAVAQAGLRTNRRSDGAIPDRLTDIHVADTIGELGLFYRLTRLAFLGGSLVPHGGQNPIEPAKLGAAILHGPHIHNFTAVYGALSAAGGTIPVRDGADLGAAVARLLRDEAALDGTAAGAAAAVEEMGGANRRAIEALEPFLIQARLRRQAETGA
jgi:3-deoxy-D-manno-octulosonic-acid transferase